MRAFVFITGGLSFSLTALGVLFKFMYWPGASLLIIIGIAFFSLLFVPTATKYFYDKN